MSEERESAELAMARALDGRPMPEWKPTRRAATDAPWIIKALRQEGYEVRPAAHPQEQALDVERLAAILRTGNIGCEDHPDLEGGYHLASAHKEDAEFIAAEYARLSAASEPGEPQP